MDTNLGLYSYWWILVVLQVVLFLPYMFLLYFVSLCRCRPGEVQWWNYMLLYFQASFWLWVIYLAQCGQCGFYPGRPMIIAAIVCAVLLYLCNLTSFFGREDKAIWNRITMDTFRRYQSQAMLHPPQKQTGRDMAPIERGKQPRLLLTLGVRNYSMQLGWISHIYLIWNHSLATIGSSSTSPSNNIQEILTLRKP